MDFSVVCRMCLKTDNLHPIFKNSLEWSRYSKALLITSGIKVEPVDGLPQQICILCVKFVNQSLKFRKNCIDVQTKLRDMKNIHAVTTVNDCDNENYTINISEIKIEEMPIESINDESEMPMESYNDESDVSEEFKAEYMDIEFLDSEDDEKPLKSLIKQSNKNVKNLKDSVINNTKSVKADNKNLSDPEILPYYPNENSKTRCKRVTCKICQKDFSIRSIDGHITRAHPGADKRKAKCELCDSFLIKVKMKRHLKYKHGIINGQEKIFGRCSYCKSEFDTKEVLIQHVENCTAKKKKSRVWAPGRELIECDICGKEMQKASLNLHKALRHAGMKPVCEHCGRAFGNKLRLNEHYRAKHGYEKFKCSYCDFESSSITAMKSHERRHRGEKPYVCETCGAKFHAAYLLAQHRQSHRVDRPLKCDECPASFKAANTLHAHKKTCHGTAVYKCSVCPRTFTSRHYTVKHMRRSHRYTEPLPAIKEHVADSDDEVLRST